ncbi:peptide ligase PGM1-related protein [Paenibacillus sp. P96]|uniref:Peptide ligase PGM1-related protein n=1 Tax=Paenibacillus zeirhizosphaerae TaxID=2987519 RepID=A0ABT9FLW0_9BACL|nr:peptide ligase PGM1-related protein [Paenibacillus sp. P96]MDP4095719.1 peptide ligase PGM1-related protein [Paenibacillus sp. P96]
MQHYSDVDLLTALSTGRSQHVFIWLFNIGAEEVWHPGSGGISDPAEQTVVNRIEEMNLLLCRSQDIIVLRQHPDPDFLEMLSQIGFAIPRIEVPEPFDALTPITDLMLADEGLLQRLRTASEEAGTAYLVPYAVTWKEEEVAARCSLTLLGAGSGLSARINDKIWSRRTAEELGFRVTEGAVCKDETEVREACLRMTAESSAPVRFIIKLPHGASGKGMVLVEDLSRLDSVLKVMKRFAGRPSLSAGWLVERWHAKQMDLNYQIYIDPQGGVTLFSLKAQELAGTVYIGSRMPAEVDRRLEVEIRSCAEQLGASLFAAGYTGIASIDGFVNEDGLLLPVIEINGRFTLSTYISFVPSILGEHKYVSRYYRIVSAEPLTYASLCSLLRERELLYGPERREGVIVYTAGTLSTVGLKQGFINRIFTLIAADSWEEAEDYVCRLERVVAGLQHVQALQAYKA